MAEDHLEKMDNLAVSARGGAIAFALKIGNTALAFLNQIILARFLGAVGIGEVLLALSLFRISSQIAKFGMEETMMRFIPLYIEQNDKARLKGTIFFAIMFCLMVSIVFILLILLLSEFISVRIFHSPALLNLLPIVAIALPAGVIRETIGGILKGYRDTYRALLPESLVVPIVRITVFLVLTINTITPLYAIIAFVAGEISALFLSIKFLTDRLALIGPVKKNYENKRVLKVAYTIIFASVSMYLFTQTDLWILGMLKSTKSVGIYGISAKLVFLVYFPMFAFGTIIPPIFSSTFGSGNYKELNRVTRKSTRWILSMSMPIILILILEGKFILGYFYGPEFVTGYPVLIILTIAHLISASTGLVGLFLQMTGHHKIYMKLNILFGVLNVILNIILVMYLGMIGAAIATAFCMASLEITCTLVINRKFSILSLAEGFMYDGIFIIIVSFLYFLILRANINWGSHILLIASLTIYLWKSISSNDIPWRLLLAKYRES